eukprot:7207717-Lingulodinium_polyedra.AAC.1
MVARSQGVEGVGVALVVRGEVQPDCQRLRGHGRVSLLPPGRGCGRRSVGGDEVHQAQGGQGLQGGDLVGWSRPCEYPGVCLGCEVGHKPVDPVLGGR